jgi:hypothetical protein
MPGVFVLPFLSLVPRSAVAIALRSIGMSSSALLKMYCCPSSESASSMISSARSERGWLITRRFLTRRAGMSTVPFSVFSSSRLIGNRSPDRSIVVNANLIANLVLRSHGISSRSRPRQSDLISSSVSTGSRGAS